MGEELGGGLGVVILLEHVPQQADGVRPDQVDLPQGETGEEAGQQSLVHRVQTPLKALRVLLGSGSAAGTKSLLLFGDGLWRDNVQQSLNRGGKQSKAVFNGRPLSLAENAAFL